MSDEVSTGSKTSDAPSYASYIKLAASIAEEVSRGRTGFGAFRNFSSISRETMRLAFNSGFFGIREKSVFPLWTIDADFLHFYLKRSHPDHRSFFDQVLASPSSYDPSCLWALFWALAQAEHEFLSRYVPFWSHEERLTGHLVSQIVERLAAQHPRRRLHRDQSGGRTRLYHCPVSERVAAALKFACCQ